MATKLSVTDNEITSLVVLYKGINTVKETTTVPSEKEFRQDLCSVNSCATHILTELERNSTSHEK